MSCKICDLFINNENFRSVKPGSHWCYNSFKWSRFGVDSMVAGSEFTSQSTQMHTLQPSNGFEWEKWRSHGWISIVCIWQVILSSGLASKIAGVHGEGVERQKRKKGETSSLNRSFLLIPLALPPPSPVLRRLNCHCPRGLIFHIQNHHFQLHINLPTGSQRPQTKPGCEAEAPKPKPW